LLRGVTSQQTKHNKHLLRQPKPAHKHKIIAKRIRSTNKEADHLPKHNHKLRANKPPVFECWQFFEKTKLCPTQKQKTHEQNTNGS
jgi:hypothetical protein